MRKSLPSKTRSKFECLGNPARVGAIDRKQVDDGCQKLVVTSVDGKAPLFLAYPQSSARARTDTPKGVFGVRWTKDSGRNGSVH